MVGTARAAAARAATMVVAVAMEVEAWVEAEPAAVATEGAKGAVAVEGAATAPVLRVARARLSTSRADAT